MPLDLTPINPVLTDGYYAKRAKVVLIANQAGFDKDFNLDPSANIADETLVQEILDQADRFVDSRAAFWGLPVGGSGGHYIATADLPLWGRLSDLASSWARARGHLLRGEQGEPRAGLFTAGQQGTDGQFTKMRKEAEKEIDELLRQRRDSSIAVGGTPGMQAFSIPACVRFGRSRIGWGNPWPL
jgi:hypothetical protein